MSETLKSILLIVGGILASSGFWAWLMNRQKKDSAEKKLLRGLAHDRIMDLGTKFLQRGNWITRDEFENLNDYLYVPYHDCGGNGTAEKLMCDVKSKLNIVNDPPYNATKPC